MKKENLLNHIGYLKKWHGAAQKNRKPFEHSPNQHLIDIIFKRMDIQNGLCVEFGAWDGIHNSNTKKLIDSGWYSVQIEPEYSRYVRLEQNYRKNSKVFCINKYIDTKDNLFDNIIKIDRNIDFCSIDIDGLDLDVFETFEKNLPKVVCIEGGQMLIPDHKRIPADISKNNIQQSLSVFNEVFNKKGYKLICSYQDSFFVKEEYYDLFNVSENLLDLYLDGLEALPRFPWIKQKLDQNNLYNEIVESVVEKCTKIDPSADLNTKSLWVDNNFSLIQKILNHYRV
tara:strand:+ start:25 stop:876 length:852 start_codon:yes stop_codon:yes gene_type:complete